MWCSHFGNSQPREARLISSEHVVLVWGETFSSKIAQLHAGAAEANPGNRPTLLRETSWS